MRLSSLADTSTAVGGASARTAKITLLAELLRAAGPDEVPIAVHYLSGELPQRQIGVGWASLRELPAPAAEPELELSEVDGLLDEIGTTTGTGSQARRKQLLAALFARATAGEQAFLRGLLTGELRQGALDGVMADAVAKAAAVPATEVRRAAMLGGDLASAARTALRDGVPGLRTVGLVVGRPIQPMLAGTAESVEGALEKLAKLAKAEPGQEVPVALEWKLDGIRVQIHRDGDRVQIFTRSLDDITDRLPEVVELARALPATTAVLDGEALALAGDGRPRPFQETASRTGSRRDVTRLREQIPLTVFLFDLLHLDGRDLIDAPADERRALLASVAPPDAVAPRLVTADPQAAEAFAKEALDRGHEGVVVKALTASYAAGRRGASWLKVKPVHTLDLVVVAAEWGHGRRSGWLSNLHLAARDPETGGFVMLGKTFKGMTDELLAWQTERLRELQTGADDWTVRVRPELVAEIAFDGVQRSTRYPGGVTLRFARVLRYREDKRAQDADTIEAVRAIAGL